MSGVEMSEKRFTFKCYDDNNCSIFDNGMRLKVEEIVNELSFLSNAVLAYDKAVVELRKENEHLRKAEKINMEYAEQIVEENYKLRIEKNNLRRENEQLSSNAIKYWKNKYDNAVETFDVDEATATKIRELEKENEELKQKLENLDLNEKNDAVKMIDGKFFIKM